MALPAGSAYVDFLPRLAKGFAQKLSAELDPDTKKAAEGAGEKFKTAFLGVAIAAGAALSKGLVDTISVEAANDKLAAQLGYTAQGAKQLGEVAGNIYAGAWGDSIESVNEALKGVLQQGLLPEDATNEQIERITTRAIDFGTVLDEDVGQVSLAVGQLLKTGLAKNADEAFDVLARGIQQGVNKSEDLLETFNEYGTQFRQLGLDAKTATGLLSQGLQAGARDADIVADALKEFAIRAQDGSTLTADGFKSIGLNADVMAKAIAKGGPDAARALDLTLDKLRAIKDPALQAQAAVALFGTQSEDLQDALYALDPSTAVEALGNVDGAAERLSTTLNDNVASKIESFKRQALMGIQETVANYVLPVLVNQLIPVITTLAEVFIASTDFISDHSTVFSVVAGIILAVFLPAIVAAGITTATNAAVMVAAWIAMQLQASLSAIRIAAAWLIAIGPIALVIAAVVGLVILIVKNWDTIARVTDELWEKFKKLTGDAWDWATRKIGEAVNWIASVPGKIKADFSALWDGVRRQTGEAWDWVQSKVSGILSWFSGIGGRISSAASGMWDGIYSAFRSAINRVIGGWNRLDFRVPGFEAFGQKIGGFTVGVPDIPMLADGGVFKGLAIVGERGPELVSVGQTSRVYSNEELGSMANGEVHYHLEPHGPYGNDFLDVEQQFQRMRTLGGRGRGARRV